MRPPRSRDSYGRRAQMLMEEATEVTRPKPHTLSQTLNAPKIKRALRDQIERSGDDG
jgi:hypothetical protein